MAQVVRIPGVFVQHHVLRGESGVVETAGGARHRHPAVIVAAADPALTAAVTERQTTTREGWYVVTARSEPAIR